MQSIVIIEKETYVSPEIEEFQVIPYDRILQESNTEPIIPGGTVPGFGV